MNLSVHRRMLGVMDITQILPIAGAVLGTVVIGLLAIVPTLLEIPHDHDSANGARRPPFPVRIQSRRSQRPHRRHHPHVVRQRHHWPGPTAPGWRRENWAASGTTLA
jgi:hypothetical protein